MADESNRYCRNIVSDMYRFIKLYKKKNTRTDIVLKLTYLSTFIIFLVIIIVNRNGHSKIKQMHSKLPMTGVVTDKTASKLQDKKVVPDKSTEYVETTITKKTRDTYINNSGCIRLEDFDPTEVPYKKSMFFIESTKRKTVKLSTRQSCSVESAARINPDRLVFVLFLGKTIDCQTDITAMISLMENYHNIRFRHIDLQTYSDNTPVQDFVRSGYLNNTLYPVEKHSDLLRILTLWKFGGIYMDLDAISLKSLPLIDLIGAEDPSSLANGIIGIIHRKDVAEKALQLYIERWDGNKWANGGPLLFTELMGNICNTKNVEIMYSGKADCNNFTIYPPEVLYPIRWQTWKILFNKSLRTYVKDIIKDSMSVHLWNHLSHDELIILKSGQPYEDIAKDYCPKVFGTVIDQF